MPASKLHRPALRGDYTLRSHGLPPQSFYSRRRPHVPTTHPDTSNPKAVLATHSHPHTPLHSNSILTMISDSQLYTLSIFLGSCAMLLITLYHFLEVNARDDEHLSSELTDEKSGVGAVKPVFAGAQANVLSSSPAAGRERGGSVKT